VNYLQPERLDALARSYALGTMAPRAKRRFARTLASSPDAAQAVARWRDVLGTLELGAPATMTPREAVWNEVRARLFEPAARPAAAGAARPSAPSSRGAGARGLAGQVATGLAGLLLGLVLIGAWVQWRPHALGLEPDTGAAPQAYVGVLLDAQGRAAVSTIARRHGRVLTVRALRPVAAGPSEQLVVWAWNDADPTPRAVAAWPHGANAAATLELPLPAEAETLLSKMTSLGLSREPAGALPLAPSGPFVVRGACAKIW
jgi:anti-sigma-K factor RskA